MNIKIEAVKLKVLSKMKDNPITRTDALKLVRHYHKDIRDEAFEQMLGADVLELDRPTIKPGPNPKDWFITDSGLQTLAELKKKHG